MTISHGADENPTSRTATADDITHRLIQDLIEEHIKMRKDLDFIKEHIVKATDTIDKVSVEVMPTVNALMDHPMFKMFAGKKK